MKKIRVYAVILALVGVGILLYQWKSEQRMEVEEVQEVEAIRWEIQEQKKGTITPDVREEQEPEEEEKKDSVTSEEASNDPESMLPSKRQEESNDVETKEPITKQIRAILEFKRLGKSVPMHQGIDTETLKKGAGMTGTKDTQLIIYGHRDSSFRFLSGVLNGDDMVYLDTDGNQASYQIAKTWIAKNQAELVFQPEVDMYLVTCYPFWYPGHAPNLFVVEGRKK